MLLGLRDAGCVCYDYGCPQPDGTLGPCCALSDGTPCDQSTAPTVVPTSAVPSGTTVESTNPFCPVGKTWNPLTGKCITAQAFGPITWPMVTWALLVFGSIGLGAFAAHSMRK